MKVQLRKVGAREKHYDLMFWQNFWMIVAACAMAVVKNELSDGMSFLKANPSMASKIIAMMSFA